jgi:predicted O-linked N-acetylglucosamine transferase (SPINDLY family)
MKSVDFDLLIQQARERFVEGADPEVSAALGRAAAEHPPHAGLALCHADALHLERRLPEAIAAYQRALALDADSFESWYGLGAAHQARGAHAAACGAFERALALKPDAHGVRCMLGEALFKLGELDAAVAQYRMAASEGEPGVRNAALANLATIIPGSPAAGHHEVLAIRMLWAQCRFNGISPLPARSAPAGRPIRVAYVSAYFGDRNWMKPVFSLLQNHDRQRFEIHLVSDGDAPSIAAGYSPHPGDRIWQVRGVPNGELAARLAAADIDVLVDLNGYSHRDRLGLIPYRSARKQFGWFNMFATTGVPGFDALIGDDSVIPPEEENFYSEPILRVSGSYLAFRVPYPTPPVAPPPCLANGHLTFGCLGSGYKLTPPTLEAWASILRAVPNTRLFVKNPTLDDDSNRAALLGRLGALGIHTHRITLAGRSEHFEFLRAYDSVDIGLDTFPYNGGTTTSEALWQGVPILTCNGDRWAGRTSRSLLVAAGHDEWVAPSMADFVAAGIRLAAAPGTPGMLSRLRAGLRSELAASAACGSAGLCRSLEAIYTE